MGTVTHVAKIKFFNPPTVSENTQTIKKENLNYYKMIRLITKSKQNKISEDLLSSIENIQLNLYFLMKDLESDFGKGLLSTKIGEKKSAEKFSYSIRDRYGHILTRLISDSLTIAKDLGIDENKFRDELDLILDKPEIYDGRYNSWTGVSTDIESMELDTGIKNWWSNRKR